MILYAQGIDNTSSLQPLPHPLIIVQYPTFNTLTAADGVTHNIGGGRMVLSGGDGVSFDDAVDLVQFIGVSTHRPSRECTVQVPDVYRIPIEYNSVVTLRADQEDGWWTNFRLEFTGLTHVYGA